MSTNDLVSTALAVELQSYGLYILSTIYRNSELSTTGGLIWASVQVCMKLPSAMDDLEEWVKARGPYPESVTVGGQKPGLEGGMRSTVVEDQYPRIKKTLQSNNGVRLKLIC